MPGRFESRIDRQYVRVLAPYAREMRRKPTVSEAMMWSALRRSALDCRFRCQVVVGHTIVDFVAPRLRLIVEIDGARHAADIERRRDAFLQSRGFVVLRFASGVVEHDLAGCLERIRSAIVTERTGSAA